MSEHRDPTSSDPAADSEFDSTANPSSLYLRPERKLAPEVEESDTPGPAPWEIVENRWEPPKTPSGAVYGSYQSGLGSVTGATPDNVFTNPAQEYAPDASPSETARKMVYAVGVVLIVAVIGFVIWAIVPPANTVPTSYSTYSAPDARFQIDQPAGWSVASLGDKQSETGDSPEGGALIKSGAAKIDITTSTITELKAQILINSGEALPDDFTKDPTQALFDNSKFRAKSILKDYHETKVDCLTTGFGDALTAEFTGVGGMLGLGGPMHGYRATVSDGSLTYVVVAQCPEKSWTVMKPVFQREIESLNPIGGPPPASSEDTNQPGATSPLGPTPQGGSAVGYGGAPQSAQPGADSGQSNGSDDSSQ